MDPTSCTGGQHLLDSVGFKKRKKEMKLRQWCFVGILEVGVVMFKVHCLHVLIKLSECF